MSSNGAPLQSISITRTENRTLPTPHVVYAILVSLPVRSWTVFRRYSEFLILHQTLTDANKSAITPPSPFPPKNSARRTFKAITGLGGLIPQNESSKEAEDVYQKERRDALEKYLRAIVSSPDGALRESDAFKDFIELPKSESLGNQEGLQRLTNSSRYVPGSYTRQPNGLETPSSSVQGFTSRTLGSKLPARETEATRKMDETGLFVSQQAQMDAQDSQLEGLAAILRRQKAMGLAINHELLEQSELLENLDREVDQTQNKMTGAEKQMKRLGG